MYMVLGGVDICMGECRPGSEKHLIAKATHLTNLHHPKQATVSLFIVSMVSMPQLDAAGNHSVVFKYHQEKINKIVLYSWYLLKDHFLKYLLSCYRQQVFVDCCSVTREKQLLPVWGCMSPSASVSLLLMLSSYVWRSRCQLQEDFFLSLCLDIFSWNIFRGMKSVQWNWLRNMYRFECIFHVSNLISVIKIYN